MKFLGMELISLITFRRLACEMCESVIYYTFHRYSS